MKRQPFTYRDAKRVGGTLLRLSIDRWAVEIASLRNGAGPVMDVVFAALKKQGGDRLTLDLCERDADDLAAACERDGKVRTAEAIRSAVRLAKAAKADDDGAAARREAFAQLAADGELSQDEIEAGKRSGLL